MKMTGNTIFVTGGGSGIGRGLAEAFHKLGNEVIISGRRKAMLEETVKANPGMQAMELDVMDPASLKQVTTELMTRYPKLNVVINNAGIAGRGDAAGVLDEGSVSSILTTNVLAPIMLTSALIEHLKAQPAAVVMYVTSGLAFTPLAPGAVYCATKAALHSYTMSQRYLLKHTKVEVLEIVPPYVQTELGGPKQATDPNAMPLDDFIAETMKAMESATEEVLTERVMPLRNNAGPGEYPFMTKFNDMMIAANH